MFSIWYNDEVLADDTGVVTQTFADATLTEQIDAAGRLTFTLPPEHEKRFIPGLLGGIIRVFRKGAEYWRGRVIQIDVDRYGARTFTCEGALAFLSDIYLFPNTEDFADGKLTFGELIAAYNRKCSTQFKLVQSTAWTPVWVKEDFDPVTPVSCKKLLESMMQAKGCFATTRADVISLTPNGGTEKCSQALIIGKNVTNATVKMDASSVYTSVLAYGTYTPPGQDAQPVDTSVYSLEHYSYGLIEHPYKWGDYGTSASGWQEYVRKQIGDMGLPGNNAKPDLTISAEAFDLSVARDDVEPLEIGKLAHITIPTMDIDEDLLIAGIKTNLNSPEKSRITLGSTRKLLSNRLEARYG